MKAVQTILPVQRPIPANRRHLPVGVLWWAIAAISVLGWWAAPSEAGTLPPIQTVFIIMMENSSWSQILSNPSTPYINNSLLPIASFCTQYYNPPANHPSEPNYLWLEAGTNFGIFDDNDPSVNHQHTTNHLVTLLNNAGIAWKSYQEDISGTCVPLTSTNGYAPRHDPFVYFDDVTATNDPACPSAIAHIRPYTELAADLANQNVAQYNFITPNLCDDMHNTCAPLDDARQQGDSWLATAIPQITNSQAFQNNGAIFLIWDESEGGDFPVPMMVLSRFVKGGGYASTNYYTHSSTLLTMEEIFALAPLLGDAANATDLSDLFAQPAQGSAILLTCCSQTPGGAFQFSVDGVTPGSTNIIECSTNLRDWICIGTNIPQALNFNVTNMPLIDSNQCFYRVMQLPQPFINRVTRGFPPGDQRPRRIAP